VNSVHAREWIDTVKHVIPYLLHVRSRADEIVGSDKAWWNTVGKRLVCPQSSHLGHAWRRRPVPIDIVVAEPPRGAICGFFDLDVGLMHEALYAALKPHMTGVCIGAVVLGTADGRTAACDYVSIAVPPESAIDPFRHKGFGHRACRKCGNIRSDNWSKYGIAFTSLRGRQVLHASNASWFIDEALVKKLRLRQRFPDLALDRAATIPEPLDGYILPEDDDWTGKLERRHAKGKAAGRAAPGAGALSRTRRRSGP
jgi:hypothetical protein